MAKASDGCRNASPLDVAGLDGHVDLACEASEEARRSGGCAAELEAELADLRRAVAEAAPAREPSRMLEVGRG